MNGADTTVLTPGAVTVVVAMFDVVEYVEECFESIAGQSIFGDVTVVVVDDGSTDGSGALADAFAARHPDRVRVIHQPNGGPGRARNRAIDLVDTEFLTFCDADDVLPRIALESLRAALVEAADAEIAIGAMESFPRPERWPWSRHLEGPALRAEPLEDVPEMVHGAGPCNKMFRTRFVRDRGLRFAEDVHFEDVLFTVPAMLLSPRLALVPETVYRYRKRDSATSIMDSLWIRTDNYADHLTVNEAVCRAVPDLPEKRSRVLRLFLVRSLQGFLLRAPAALPQGELSAYFHRARELLCDVPPDVVDEGARDLRHRFAFVALITGDEALFRDRSGATRSLEAHDGELSLALDVPDDARPLLRLEPMRPTVEELRVDTRRGRVVVTGRIGLRGVDLSLPLEVPLRLRLRRGFVVPTTPVEHPELAAQDASHRWMGFRAEIPFDALPFGRLEPRLVLDTPTGSVSARLRPSVGLLRSARVLATKEHRILVGTTAEGRVTVQVARAASPEQKARWRASLVRRDLRHAWRRGPLWRARLLRLATRPLFRRRRVWLLGERGDTAQDNGAALFTYLRRHRPDIDAHFVTDDPTLPTLDGLGNVVRRGSLRHRVLTTHAALLVGAYDIDSYLLPPQWGPGDYLHHLAWRVGSRRAFLQHGVIYNDVSRALHRGVTGLDLFVTSGAREAEFVRRWMGYDAGQVVTTGLPRFDLLSPGAPGGVRRVLFMPTWRSHLVAPSYDRSRTVFSEFENSHFFRFVRDFLHHPRLAELLDRHDLTLEVYPHYEMRAVASQLVPDHPRVELAEPGRTVREALGDCSLFLTDWSSVFFDAAYLGKPVVLAPFDEEEFRARQYPAGWFDPVLDGFGPAVRTPDALVAAIGVYAGRGFRRETRYDERVAAFFSHRDTRASERVASELLRVTPP